MFFAGRRVLSHLTPGAVAPATSAPGVVAASTVVSAGECPAHKAAASRGAGMRPTMPKGATDRVLATIDLTAEPAAILDRSTRLRRLVIETGGTGKKSSVQRQSDFVPGTDDQNVMRVAARC